MNKFNIGKSYYEELIYSPNLDFLSETQRRQLAVALYKLYVDTRSGKFEQLVKAMERSLPQVLYRTGIPNFDLRKYYKVKSYMIRGPKTRTVILPYDINVSQFLENAKHCPNLETVYFDTRTDLSLFRSLNVSKLTHKDLAKWRISNPPV